MIKKVIEIVEEASKILMTFYDGDYKINYKMKKEIVTTADIKVDEFLQKKLKEKFPNDQILSEETENTINNYSGKVWIIDPLDGTRQFTQKIPYFSINVGLCLNGTPILGVVSSPAKKEIYFAENNKGTFVKTNDEVIQLSVSKINKISEGKLITNIPDKKQRPFDYILHDLNVREKLPMDNFGSLLIAAGEAEFFIHPSRNLKKWDTCATQVIIEEAGGKITDLSGNPLDYKQESLKWENSVVISNGIMHDKIIEEIQKL